LPYNSIFKAAKIGDEGLMAKPEKKPVAGVKCIKNPGSYPGI
jgi:hypothetical protein